MEHLLESWSLIVILLAAFVIGWAAETAQTFISRALALSVLAWLQTLPEFAVEAAIAWSQDQSLMIANLTGSLRLLVGLGWPMIFFVHFFTQWARKKKAVKEIVLEDEDYISVLFLFVSIAYFFVILTKRNLAVYDSVILGVIYFIYLGILLRMPAHEVEEEDDLPWIGKQIVKLPKGPRIGATVGLFAIGGVALYVTVHPFINTLEKWAALMGISSFFFIQWIAPFLSEFPEKVSAFNWARQTNKAPMAVMNMVNSNINQWTMLAAMIPIVYNLSLGRFEPVYLDDLHTRELALTVAQSILGGVLLLDMRFSIFDATLIFLLWFVQLIYPSTHEAVSWAYAIWTVVELAKFVKEYYAQGKIPRAIELLRNAKHRRRQKKGAH